MFAGSSPITFTSPSSKHAKSQGPLLRRHYPASTLIRPCPTPVLAATFRNVEAATLADERVSPDYPNHLFRRAVPTTPADQAGARVDCFPRSLEPSPNGRRVGIRIVTFEAYAGFTHVTARRIAQPPKVTFVTRLRPSQLPDQAARQLPDSIDNYPGETLLH